jgi:uncharacterized protein with PIN domain
MPFRYKCNLCAHVEIRDEAADHIPRCPECDKAGKWGSLYRKKVKERVPKPDEMGFCCKCGKGVSRGEYVDGKLYGPECVKKYVYRGGSDE